MGRHGNSAGAILDYEHVGRTVLISDGMESSPKVPCGFWVEGESDDNQCPLRDVSPFTNPFGPTTFLGDLSSRASTGLSKARDKIQSESGSDDVKSVARSLIDAASELTNASRDMRSKFLSITPAQAASIIGLDPRFVESELAMLDSFGRGTFLEHHLEPSYFAAMRNAVGSSKAGGEKTV